MAAALIGCFLTSLLVLAWGTYVLGGKYTHGLLSVETLEIAVLMLAGTLLAMSVGILLGLLFKSAETASIAANAVIWPIMMLGGFWIPKFMVPPEIRAFAEANPFSVLMYAVVEISCYGRTLEPYLPALAASLCLTAILIALSVVLFERKFSRMLEE